jgi:hypothetical protein
MPTLDRSCLAGATLTALIALAPMAADVRADLGSQVKVNQDAQLIGEFTKRAEAYAELHRKIDSATLPEVSNSASPSEVTAHQQALQRGIAKVRARAKQGDIFTQPIRAYFRRQITRALSGPDAGQLRASINEENPGLIRLRVNGAYPGSVPTTTMPPQILAALPKLPQELEFRFIGRRLILLDVHAQLVVDYIDDAIPN